LRRSKYGVRTDKAGKEARTVDNVLFASMKEAKRYQELKLLQRAYKIYDLELQPRYALPVNGVTVCSYVGDFKYFNSLIDAAIDANPVIEDVKGVKTPVYRLKKKLMKAIHNIEIQEV